MQRYEAYHTGDRATALCFALDGDWGAGKSFFVERWSKDIEACQHPIIHFDAWANDLSDDPLVGFLAALKEELAPLVAKRPLGPAVAREVNKRVERIFKQAGAATVPALKIIGAGLLKKYAGVALEEVAEAFDAGEPAETSTDTVPDFSEATDKFFEAALKNHTSQLEAIKELKSSIQSLVSYLTEKQVIAPPLFVFIDELDRCRPDYAIRLLEGIKHLFNASGVCFVVSTNLRQLSSAVKVVYGNEFDAYRYLKKFFSFDYILPAPDNIPFAKSLFQDSLFVKSLRAKNFTAITGMPWREAFLEDHCALCFAVIAGAMNLNLRSQRQVFEHIEAASVGWTEGRPMVLIYMFFLAALLHKGLDVYDQSFGEDQISLGEKLSEWGINRVPIEVLEYSQHREHKRVMLLDHILGELHTMARIPLNDALKELQNRPGYPRALFSKVTAAPFRWHGTEYTSIAMTGMLVRASGQLRGSADS
jgi:hypothetical protein